jgi:molybdopterin molybdotransferase
MKPFFKVKTSSEILTILRAWPALPSEWIPLGESLNRVLSEGIPSPEDLPSFPRATMDGYALRARDTFGASESVPALLNLAGEITMGQAAEIPLDPGSCFRIATGGMLPPGADAVAMIEHSQILDEQTVEIFKPLSPLDHVIQVGEDILKGQQVLPKGLRLRPQDVGLLAGLGIQQVPVHQKPRVAVLSTGDEIVPLEETPGPGKIRDINSFTLQALAAQQGAYAVWLGVSEDRFQELRDLVRKGLDQADVILISGGSSVGSRDHTLEVIHSFPDSELLAHGISISPGKPTILARLGNKILWGLPGHTVSAMVVFSLFVKPCLHILEGEQRTKTSPNLKARLSRNVASAQGREDYVRVSLQEKEGQWEAVPILGKSGLISTMVRSDGLIRIDQHCEGLEKGEWVEVLLF